MRMYLPLLYYIPTHTEPAARNAAATRRPLNSSRVVGRRERVTGACIYRVIHELEDSRYNYIVV